jgi:2-dehydro-3-deoxyphosphogluconate aldolase / (4S)-4-hydroxy-2-oxoglutarate aldolase
MTDRPAIPAQILEGRVIAIGRRIPPRTVPRVAAALVAGGVTAVELTLNEPEAEALRAIESLAGAADGLGAVVGAGTVLSTGAAQRALDAGARFMVMPVVDTALIAWCAARAVPCFPGALTPTEMLAAFTAGASAVKLFPAVTVGPGYLEQLRGPLPQIPVVPTGGVSAETAGAWVAAGAIALGMGGWLIGDGEPAGVTARARLVRGAIDAVGGA